MKKPAKATNQVAGFSKDRVIMTQVIKEKQAVEVFANASGAVTILQESRLDPSEDSIVVIEREDISKICSALLQAEEDLKQ